MLRWLRDHALEAQAFAVVVQALAAGVTVAPRSNYGTGRGGPRSNWPGPCTHLLTSVYGSCWLKAGKKHY
jgi:hypothetical protein